MDNLSKAGSCFFAAALIGFGGLQVATGHLSPDVFPFPKDMPAIPVIARVTGIIFTLAGAAILFNKMTRISAVAAGTLFFIMVLYPHLPKLFSDLHNVTEWVGFTEILAISCGCFILAAGFGNSKTLADAGKYIFAAILLVFGIIHVKYEDFIITLIPAWLPAKTIWSYLVTGAFLLTPIAVIINIKARLALTLTGLMFLTWVLILHLPRVVNKSSSDSEWMSMFVALAFSGICFILAGRAKPKPDIFLES